MNRYTLFFLATAILLLPAIGAANADLHPQFAQRHWTIANGLPTNSLQTLCQTRDGYIWIGTDDGLARFDGKNFTVYSTSNSKLPHNSIQALLEDPRGNLWIGTRSGLASYQDGEFVFFKTERGKANNAIYDIAYEAPNRIWIGTEEGLNLFDTETNTFQTLTVRDGLPDNLVSRIFLDQQGRLWASTPKGLVLKTGKTFRSFTTEVGLLANRVLAFQESEQGIWLGTSAGMNLFQNGRITTPEGIPPGILCSLLVDSKNRLWVGYSRQMLAFNSDREMLTFPGIKDTMAVLEDKDGNLWFASFGGGLFSMAPSRISTLFVDNQQSEALSVYESRSHGLLASSRSGLYRWSSGKFEMLHTLIGVSSIAEDLQGKLYAGTFTRGVQTISASGVTDITVRDGLPSNVIHSLLTASNGEVWIGTAIGPATLDTQGRIHSFSKLLPSRVFTMAEDAAKGIWMGTEGRGLVRYQDGKFQSFEERDGFAAETVVSLYAEMNGTVWIGTDGSGLYRYRYGKFSQIKTRDGLYHDRIFQILDDRRGNLWMGTNKGIFRARKADLNDFAEKKIGSFVSAHYDEADGMQNSECMSYSAAIRVAAARRSSVLRNGTGYCHYRLRMAAE